MKVSDTMKQFFLACCVLLAFAALPVPRAAAAEGDGWQLTTKGRSFMLLKMDFFESLDRTAAAGLKAIETTPPQDLGGGLPGKVDYTMDDASRAKLIEKCTQTGVKIPIVYASAKTDDDCRQLFKFAKAMGAEVIVMEPALEQLDLLEKLCDQYQISLAIHNHPQPSHFWNTKTVLDAIKGRGKRIGACADTGHWKRSGLDPVACLKELEGHIIMLHFKDVAPDAKPAAANTKKNKKKAAPKPTWHDVEWGTGDCQMAAMFAELKRQHFKGYFSMEYEYPATFLECLPKNVAYFNRCKAMTENELKALAAAH